MILQPGCDNWYRQHVRFAVSSSHTLEVRNVKQITVDPTVCTGCRACEMACSFFHTDTFSYDLSRIHISKVEEEGIDVPLVCRMCRRPACVDSCPTGALSRLPKEGVIALDADLCAGCGICADACPHLAISYHPQAGTPLICDLCGGDPACVKRCVVGAIRYEKAGNRLARDRTELARDIINGRRGRS